VWNTPDDFEYNETDPLAGLAGLPPNGFLAALCDGSVRLIARADTAPVKDGPPDRYGLEVLKLSGDSPEEVQR
jgi:hypothetical protein